MRVNAVGVIYNNHYALKQTRLTISPGEMVGILGVTGAGKTSLLRCLAGDLAPSEGWVEIDGQDVRLARKTAFQPQGGHGLARLTVAEHRAFMSLMTDDFDARRFDLLCRYFSLNEDVRYDQMSPGMKIKFSTCLCLALNRPYWILDEPLFGSDPAARRDMIHLLAGLVDETQALIVATHLTGEIDPLLTRAIILERGKVVADLELEQLRAKGLRLTDVLLGDSLERSEQLNQILDIESEN